MPVLIIAPVVPCGGRPAPKKTRVEFRSATGEDDTATSEPMASTACKRTQSETCNATQHQRSGVDPTALLLLHNSNVYVFYKNCRLITQRDEPVAVSRACSRPCLGPSITLRRTVRPVCEISTENSLLAWP
jgi:hypothetical protein